jgi:C1A family cysteine protease
MVILVVTLAIAMALPVEVSQWEMTGAFVKFMDEYKRQYGSAGELMRRYEIFAKNYKTIKEYNSNQTDFVLAVNQFADLTRDEFRSQHLGYMPNQRLRAATNPTPAPKWGPPNPVVDWRKTNKVTRVKNQYSCGSCWAFSAIGAVESLHAIVSGTLTEYSEQELVDCAREYGNEGCNGGEMYAALQYVVDRGISLESEYRYEGRDGRCRKKSSSFKPRSYLNATRDDNDELLSILNHQPVSIAVEADNAAFMFYRSGIITKDCGTKLDHGILLVGANIDPDKQIPYWIVKNSWGRSWGLEGYAYIKRDSGKSHGVCGIAMDNSYPIA